MDLNYEVVLIVQMLREVHMYACKRILGLSAQSPHLMVYSKLQDA